MNAARFVSAVVVAAGLLASDAVYADPHAVRGRIGWDITIGVPGPWYYPSPYHYYPYNPYYYPPRHYYYDHPPRVVVPAPPTEYIERESRPQSGASGAMVPGYWYYCRSQNGYYPYVKECPSAWERVSPQPPAPPAQK